MARDAPQFAMFATLVSAVFASVTFVATTTSVVLRSAGSSSPRSAPRVVTACFMTSTESAKPPDGRRAPATMRPLRQSRISPAAFTTASADTTTSPTLRLAVPRPPFIPPKPRLRCIFPTVAPAPTPTLPSATDPVEAAAHAL